jgi:hypothetical protein
MMQELKQKVGGMDFGHKLSAALSVLSILICSGALLTAIVGKNWNPFELGRQFERHCIEQEIKHNKLDSEMTRIRERVKDNADSLIAHSRTIGDFKTKFDWNSADHTRYENFLAKVR